MLKEEERDLGSFRLSYSCFLGVQSCIVLVILNPRCKGDRFSIASFETNEHSVTP